MKITSSLRHAEIFERLQAQVQPACLQQPSAAASILVWGPGYTTREKKILSGSIGDFG